MREIKIFEGEILILLIGDGIKRISSSSFLESIKEEEVEIEEEMGAEAVLKGKGEVIKDINYFFLKMVQKRQTKKSSPSPPTVFNVEVENEFHNDDGMDKSFDSLHHHGGLISTTTTTNDNVLTVPPSVRDERNIFLKFWQDEILMLPMYSQERLHPLRTYQYSGKDNSLISNWILQPYWKWFVTLFPLWMAPNLITLLALAWMLSALILVLVLMPDLKTIVQYSVLYFYFALCFFMYSTFDSIDGKQARRTGTSSPLGELFDHGCDSLNCSLGCIVQIAAMALGTSFWSLLILIVTFSAFYLATWENYHTGTLILGYVTGPTEGLLIGSLIMIISAIMGPSFWMDPMHSHFGMQWFWGNTSVVAFLFSFFTLLFIFASIPSSLWEVYKSSKKNFYISLLNLSPLGVVILSLLVWLYSPYSNVLDIGGEATRPISMFALFILSFGLGFSKMATNIIYSHLTHLPFPSLTILMYPLIFGALIINFPYFYGASIIGGKWDITLEMMYIFLWFIFNCLSYGLWVFHMCRSFCLFLDIWCLSIKGHSVNHLQ